MYQISTKCYCLIFLIDLLTWAIISNASEKYKERRNLEVPQKALLKPILKEQNDAY